MSSTNPFGLLGDDDSEDPTQLLASKHLNAPAQVPVQAKKAPAQAPTAQAKPAAKLPSKPLPPSQAVRESKNEDQRGGGRGAARGGGRGRGGRGFNRDAAENENAFGNTNGFSRGYKLSEDGDAGKDSSERRPYGAPRGGGGFRGGRRGGSNGETTEGERPRRVFDRHSGTGRGSGFKREGAGRGNWGTPADEISTETEEPVAEGEKIVDVEKPSEQEEGDANKEIPANEPEEKEPEEKEMTLEEYEKVLEEKRKPLVALRSEERKVNMDKEFESMQILSNKKNDDEFFVKLGSDKDKRKEAAEKAKKSVSINEFLKPAKGEYPRSGGRGQGRGRGRAGSGAGINNYNVQAPAIEDVGEFPSLAAFTFKCPLETVKSSRRVGIETLKVFSQLDLQ
ncbi:plasminogen activator inhibitor 1 RNA-binding protein-like [Dorcoceras hygrometricum]|uniref:Plasminogen activator inhibitor 1 RNA-binding protein-like n=1 Tax=Dorcoceras hygrometricum TaxID=472368 RepID=A0A2Z7BS24_9LAMI|nr:plasminogen activator inhibitor 1 RNA-binding protein-like [Dorcoceras hygrometricum]